MEPETWVITQRIGAREIDPIVFEAERAEAERYAAQVSRDAFARPESSIEVQLIQHSTGKVIISYSAKDRDKRQATKGKSKGKGTFPEAPPTAAGFNPWLLVAIGGAVWYLGSRKRG